MTEVTATSQPVDDANASFWDELCGTVFAQQLGITDLTPESLRRFDQAYFDYYPYLAKYLPSAAEVSSKRLLEIGLGFGTVGHELARRGADYHGLDIARGPVEMMRSRISQAGLDEPTKRVVQGSALEIPHEDASLDWLVSIGCLHHTGDLAGAMREVERVVRPGGRALVMVYNSHSLRQLHMAARHLATRATSGERDHDLRADYDSNSKGEAAPCTEFSSKRELRAMLSGFSEVSITVENFDDLGPVPGLRIPRRRLLGAPARVVGLDLYALARK